ncbi:MAG: M1 family peptidase, partial [Bacteroidia bacterium]|nr:M1 family peptidase [Bacteroidia bacterium]
MKPLLLMILAGSVLNGFSQTKVFTKEDTLIGSNSAYRNWWDVMHYDVSVKPDYSDKSISGNIILTYKVTEAVSTPVMQIDLQQPLTIDSLFYEGAKLTDVRREKNRWMFFLGRQEKDAQHQLRIFYHGKPKVARNAPWDGGFVWKRDSLGNPWMSVACQGAGASIWFPCKDLQADEPDQGARLAITVPDSLKAIGNGKLVTVRKETKGLSTY